MERTSIQRRGLCLSRRVGQRVICRLPDGEEIVLTVMRQGLHIAAPQNVTILREEPVERLEESPAA